LTNISLTTVTPTITANGTRRIITNTVNSGMNFYYNDYNSKYEISEAKGDLCLKDDVIINDQVYKIDSIYTECKNGSVLKVKKLSDELRDVVITSLLDGITLYQDDKVKFHGCTREGLDPSTDVINTTLTFGTGAFKKPRSEYIGRVELKDLEENNLILISTDIWTKK
jgi:hypothetical protein